MHKWFLFSFLLALAFGSLAQRKEFTQFDAHSAPLSEWLQNNSLAAKSDVTISVDAFEMGNLITWKQYKEFLEDVKRMKGNYAFEQLLPILPEQHLKSCLNTKEFDSSPVVGVSWTNAHEYCKWRMIVDNKNQSCWEDPMNSYRLPSQLEWISAYLQSKGSKFKIDLNTEYSDWTTTSFDESMNTLKDYRYLAQKMDPPALKRKRVIGSSFFVPSSDYIRHSFSYYQDSSYSHIGFRLIREMDEYVDLDEIDDYLGDCFAKFWCKKSDYYLQQVVKTNEFKAHFQVTEGRKTGRYESYYPNGVQKSSGLFYKNQRVGNWIVWDSLGNKVIERNYLSPYRFEQTFPKIKDEQARALRDAQRIELSRNESGLLNYPHIQERSVFWSKRIWTRLEPNGNEQFFYNNRLIDAIKLGVELGDIQLYDTITDQFTDTISSSEFAKRLSGEVVAYTMKEDCFYDLDRGISSTRPIGICPIVIDTINGKAIEREIAWIYFPQLRKTLGAIQCFTTGDRIAHVTNHKYQRGGTSTTSLDDLFFFRDFHRTIVGTASYNGKIEIPLDKRLEEEIRLLEREHDIWLGLYAE